MYLFLIIYFLIGLGAAMAGRRVLDLRLTILPVPRPVLYLMLILGWPTLLSAWGFEEYLKRILRDAPEAPESKKKVAPPVKRSPVEHCALVPGMPTHNGSPTGKISQSTRQKIVKQWFYYCGSNCLICNVQMRKPKSYPKGDSRQKEVASIDHILARSLGGTNSLSNLRVICFGCNNAKAIGEGKILREQRCSQQESRGEAMPSNEP